VQAFDPSVLRAVAMASGVSRIADITDLDRIGAPVVSAARPASLSLAIAAGKGPTREAAALSAVMEAFERHAAEIARLSTVRVSLTDAAADPAFADAHALPRDRRVALSATPRWVAARRLDGGGALHVPYDLVHLRQTVAEFSESDGFHTTTNGLAAAFDETEAALHALCELIERDALALAAPPARGRGPLRGASIAASTVAEVDPFCAALLHRCRAAGLVARFRDLTTDIGVPVIHCRLAQAAGSELTVTRGEGVGCDPDPTVAARRALTEAAQSRLVVIAGARDDLSDREYLDPPPVPDEQSPSSSVPLPTGSTGDAVSKLAWTLARLRGAGFTDAAIVVLAEGPAGVVALRAVAPGLEGASIVPGYAPGARRRARSAALAFR
jgi:ribosomal protein S12 methylthiotransferase accessory factor